MGTKEKSMTFHLNARKHVRALRVLRHSHRLPREVVEPPAFESHPDTLLGSLLQLAVLQQGGCTG